MRFITSIKSVALTLVLAVTSYTSVGVVTTTTGIAQAQASSNYWKRVQKNQKRENKKFVRNLVAGAAVVTLGTVVYAATHKSNRNQQNYYDNYNQNHQNYPSNYQQNYQQQSNIANVHAYFGNKIPQHLRQNNFQHNYNSSYFSPYEKIIPLQNGKQARVTIRSEPALLVYQTTDGRQFTEYLTPNYR